MNTLSYLADRRQTTAIYGATSEYQSNALGIPQGTLRRPIFSIVFIIDITTSDKTVFLRIVQIYLRNVSVP